MRDRAITSGMIIGCALALLPFTAAADCMFLPDNALSTWEFASFGEASIWILPNGQGPELTQAQTFGGAGIDKSIRVELVDANGNPLTSVALDEIWLFDFTGAVAFCGGEQFAHAYGTEPGQYLFTGSLAGGGSHMAGPVGLQIAVCNLSLFVSPSTTLNINSPDIDGDLQVDITDLSLFAADFFGVYDYRSDFIWDGQIDLGDLAVFAQGLGTSCVPD